MLTGFCLQITFETFTKKKVTSGICTRTHLDEVPEDEVRSLHLLARFDAVPRDSVGCDRARGRAVRVGAAGDDEGRRRQDGGEVSGGAAGHGRSWWLGADGAG